MNSSSQGSLKETDPKAYLEQIIQTFFTDPLPDACEALMYRLDLALQNNSELSAFERYAARLLKQAHADKLRPIAARHHIEAGRLSATNLAWFRFDESELEPQEVEMLLAIESIINRLIMMVMNAPSPEIYTYLVSNTGEGSAFEQDWALLRNSVLEAPRLVNGFEEKNPLLTIRETTASVGGEWDMRTRIAFAMENLVLPFRLSYRFDCDSNAGAVLIDFVAPTYVLFPDLIWNTTINNWDDVSALHGFDQSALTVRTMALLAALGFGSSVGVTKVIVTALADNVEGAVLCSAEFSRMAYLNGFLPSLTSGAFTAVENTAKLDLLEKMLSATYLSIKVGPDGALEEVERIEAGFPNRGGELYNDTRSLPASIQSFLHAQVVSDLDIYHVEDEKLARELVEKRKFDAKEEQFKLYKKVSLDNLFSQIEEGSMKKLPIIVKADVQGSVEAVSQSLSKLSNEEVKVEVIHGAVGAVTESDVMLAKASGAIIVGFNVRPNPAAADNAKRDGVDIRLYRVIYDAIEEIETAMKGMLAPKYREVDTGRVEVRQVMKLSSVGVVAGSYVLDGKVQRNGEVRVVRDGIIVAVDKIAGLRRFKDDVKEVAAGYECGITLEKFTDIKDGDIFEAFVTEEYRD